MRGRWQVVVSMLAYGCAQSEPVAAPEGADRADGGGAGSEGHRLGDVTGLDPTRRYADRSDRYALA
jgi:hypothetical protein